MDQKLSQNRIKRASWSKGDIREKIERVRKKKKNSPNTSGSQEIVWWCRWRGNKSPDRIGVAPPIMMEPDATAIAWLGWPFTLRFSKMDSDIWRCVCYVKKKRRALLTRKWSWWIVSIKLPSFSWGQSLVSQHIYINTPKNPYKKWEFGHVFVS